MVQRHQEKQPSKGPRINQFITTSPVRLVEEDGNMLGIVPIEDALNRAALAGLDLVEVSPNASPPVCKILDYGKYRYEEQKKKKEAKKNQKIVKIKETKLRLNVGEHDYKVKLNATRRFLEHGDKVKVSLRFRGREITHKDLAEELFARFHGDVSDIAKVEQHSKVEGRQLVMMLAPL